VKDKLEKALELSEEILENLELESAKLTSIVLKCLRLARLINDIDGIEWLQYETGGYKRDDTGHITSDAFKIAKLHGRAFISENKEYVFTTLAESLEASIEPNLKRINNITTDGISAAGDYANIAMINLAKSAERYGKSVTDSITLAKERLGILKGEYYKYALNVNLELGFSKTADDIFKDYRQNVDQRLSSLISDKEEKLSAIYDRLSENNKESWSQAADTCRKLLKSVSDSLFKRVYPNYSEKSVKLKSGKELDITGDKYINRLGACLEYLNPMLIKHTEYLVKWIDDLNSRICKGVHEDVMYNEIKEIIIHTYICIGDILTNIDIKG